MQVTPHWPSSIALLAYLLAVLALGSVHSPLILALALVLVLALIGQPRWQLLRRSLWAMMAFNLSVSLGYVAMLLWQGEWAWLPLLRMNLRVAVLVLIGFWCVHRVNLLRALAFSPTLARLLALTAGQVRVLARMVQDFRLAAISRSAGMRQPWSQRLRHGAWLCASLIDKSVASADEATRAMRARGCFDD